MADLNFIFCLKFIKYHSILFSESGKFDYQQLKDFSRGPRDKTVLQDQQISPRGEVIQRLTKDWKSLKTKKYLTGKQSNGFSIVSDCPPTQKVKPNLRVRAKVTSLVRFGESISLASMFPNISSTSETTSELGFYKEPG